MKQILLDTACKCGFFYRKKRAHTFVFPGKLVLQVEKDGLYVCTDTDPHTSEFSFFIPREYFGKIVKTMLFLSKVWGK